MKTLEEFCTEAKNKFGAYTEKINERSYYNRYVYAGGKSKDYNLTDLVLYVSWSGGGMYGASCWDDHPASMRSEGEHEPEFEALDNILEKYAPNITYLQAKKINKLIKYDSFTDGDYYGNTSVTNVKVLPLKDLYVFLVERGYLNA